MLIKVQKKVLVLFQVLKVQKKSSFPQKKCSKECQKKGSKKVPEKSAKNVAKKNSTTFKSTKNGAKK